MVKLIATILLALYVLGGLLQGAEALAHREVAGPAATGTATVKGDGAVPTGAVYMGVEPGAGLSPAESTEGAPTAGTLGITPISLPAVQVQFTIIEGTAATFEGDMTQPAIATQAEPVSVARFTIIQGTAAVFDRDTAGANIDTRVEGLGVPEFTIIQGTAAVLERDMKGPNIAAMARPLRVPQFTIIQGMAAVLERNLTGVNIATRVEPLRVPQFTIIQGTAAVLERDTTGANIATRVEPLRVPQFTIIQGTAAVLGRDMMRANIATLPQPLRVPVFTIIQGTAAVLGRGLSDPFPRDATILSAGRGVLLQGTHGDSSGAFLRVNGEDHFAGVDGTFSFGVAPGSVIIRIRAPGYLPVIVKSLSGSDVVLNGSELLTIPELTMVYGDANGDGVVNSKDISLGSRNFGALTAEVPLTATQVDPLKGDATIRSAGVHIQGGDDSTGAFLVVDGKRHYVDRDGSLSFTVAPGTHKIQIRAPGHLPVEIVSPSGSEIALNAGELLVIPELTMVYGDANGDGVIDVRDLAVGASNFGKSSGELKIGPQQAAAARTFLALYLL